jgi:hypothetical protein
VQTPISVPPYQYHTSLSLRGTRMSRDQASRAAVVWSRTGAHAL